MAVTGGGREGREGGVIRKNPGGRLCPGSNSGWQRVVATSVPRNLPSFVSLAGLSNPMLGLHRDQGLLEPWDWTNRRAEHMVQNILWPSPSLLDARKHLQELLDLQIIEPPLGNACPVPVCVRGRCSSLSVSLSLSTAAGRNPVPRAQRSSRRSPSSTLHAEQSSEHGASGQVRVTPGQVENKSPRV